MALKKNCIIVAEDTCIGDQLSTLIQQQGWQFHVVQSDSHAYEYILLQPVDIVIADIDAAGLGGLAVLAYCHHQHPSITTFAITHKNDSYRKKLARDLGGCGGFFYLMDDKVQVDASHGIAAELVA